MVGFVRDGGRWFEAEEGERGSAEESSTYVILAYWRTTSIHVAWILDHSAGLPFTVLTSTLT